MNLFLSHLWSRSISLATAVIEILGKYLEFLEGF